MNRLSKLIAWATRNEWLVFSPFLVLYVLVVLVGRHRVLQGDATRYLMYAENLWQGNYAPEGTEYIWNGPGFPIFLMPFVGLGAHPLVISISQALLLYIANVFLYKSFLRFMHPKLALGMGLFWAAHFSVYESLPVIMSEIWTIFIICCFVTVSIATYRRWKIGRPILGWTILLASLIAWLILTKVLFGYVLLFCLLIIGLNFLFSRNRPTARLIAKVLILGFLFQSPYLIYTYKLTGKFPYWGNSGGSSLYWMTTPYVFENGSWEHISRKEFRGKNFQAIAQNHQDDIKRLRQSFKGGYSGVETDRIYKELAIKNIKTNPGKFLMNCVANVSRMFFGFPNSYQYENLKFLKFFPNFVLLPFFLFSLLIGTYHFSRLPLVIRSLWIFALLYLGFSVPLSAYPRMAMVVFPILLLVIGFILDKTVRFKFHFFKS